MKIGLKLTMAFLAIALLVGVTAYYSNAVTDEIARRVGGYEGLKNSFLTQKTNLLSFAAGDKEAEVLISNLHSDIGAKLDSLIEVSSDSEINLILRLKNISEAYYNKILDENDPNRISILVENQDTASRNILEANSGIRGTMESDYRDVGSFQTFSEGSSIFESAGDAVGKARNLIIVYDPNKNNSVEVISQFRQLNDKIVGSFVYFLVNETDLIINSIDATDAEMKRIKDSLTGQRDIASGINATTFPAVNEEQAKQAGINATGELKSREAVLMVTSLGNSIESNILELESRGMKFNRTSGDDVGDNKDSVQVLIFLINSAQTVRYEGEIYANSKLETKNSIERFFTPLNNEFDTVANELISLQSGSYITISIIFVLAVLAIIIFGFLFSRTISNPIKILKGITGEVAKRNFDVKNTIKSKDEIGDLTNSFISMAGELKRTDKLRSDFVNIAAHELKTPLTSIIGYTDILKDDASLPKDAKDKIGIVYRNALREKDLVSAILDVSRMESGTMVFEFKETDINKIIETAISDMKQFANSKNLKLEAILADGVPKIEADGSRILQVAENLINNAIKFTNKGSVTVTTKLERNEAVVSVKDTGIGISEDDIKRLFTKFFQAEQGLKRGLEGTGLGLAIVKGIIDIHGGRVWAESTLGKGSTFSFALPLKPRSREETVFKNV